MVNTLHLSRVRDICIVALLVLGANAQAAAPSLDASATSAVRNMTSVVATLPAHSAGDLLVIAVASDDGATSPISDISGWSRITEIVNTIHSRFNLFYKTAGASEADPTVTTSGGNAYFAIRSLAISGWDGNAPVTANNAYTGSSTTTFTAPDATATGDALVLRFLVYSDGSSTAITGTPDTLVGTNTSGGTTGSDQTLVTTQKDAVAGAVGSADFTANDGERGIAVTAIFHGGAGVASGLLLRRRRD